MTNDAGDTPQEADALRLTEVHLVYRSNRRYRLLFGTPFDVVAMDQPHPPGARIAFFRPGERFGLALWEANDYGTVRWRVLVCRALHVGQSGTRVPQVVPGAHVLMDVAGAARAKAALHWLAPYVQSGDVAGLPDATFIETGFRLATTPLVRLRAYAQGPL